MFGHWRMWSWKVYDLVGVVDGGDTVGHEVGAGNHGEDTEDNQGTEVRILGLEGDNTVNGDRPLAEDALGTRMAHKNMAEEDEMMSEDVEDEIVRCHCSLRDEVMDAKFQHLRSMKHSKVHFAHLEKTGPEKMKRLGPVISSGMEVVLQMMNWMRSV